MTKMNNHCLVTTADKRTWPHDLEIIFLNQNCLKQEKNNGEMNYQKIANFSETISTALIHRNRNEIKNLDSKLFPILIKFLNNYHSTDFSPEFWRILVGPWFQYFLIRLICQKNELESAINSYNIDIANFIKLESEEIVPKDFNDLWNLHKLDSYLSHIDMRLMEEFNNKNIEINAIKSSLLSDKDYELIYRENLKPQKLKLIFKIFNYLSEFTIKNSMGYISSTYLPFSKEVRFHILLRQIPIFWRSHLKYVENNAADMEMRLRNVNEIVIQNNLGIVERLILELIPICYLEGFGDLIKAYKLSKLPKEPKFIFTSNDFNSYELFKIYVAISSEKGVKYIVGQHGNNYGTFNFYLPLIEELTANKFITWGWSSNPKKHIPGFVFKNVGKNYKSNPSGGLLLIQFPLQINPMLIHPYFNSNLYLKSQFEFINTLEPVRQSELTIRLSSTTENNIKFEAQKFLEYNQSLKVEFGTEKIEDLISKCRLTIFSYDSTGFLENLAMNNPTMAFWQFGLSHLNEQSKEFYGLLEEAGIIYFDPKKIALKVNQIWNDVESWWFSEEVQKARVAFCNQYARSSKKPLRDLRDIINICIK